MVFAVIVNSAGFTAEAKSSTRYDIDKMITDFVKTEDGKAEIANRISEKVSEIGADFYNSSGTYNIHSTFIVPIFNDPTEKYIVPEERKDNVRYSLVYLNNKAAGLMIFSCWSVNDTLSVYYYPFPEYYVNNVQEDEVLIFNYGWVTGDDNDILIGGEVPMIFTYVNDKPELLVIDRGVLGENIETDYRTIVKPIKTNIDLVRRYNTPESTGNVICSLNLSFDNYISDSMICTIQDKDGKYLTYSSGKYTISDHSGKNQLFRISRCSDKESYTISPVGSSDKCMSVGGNTEFYISSAYYGQPVYQIISKNSGRYMKSNNNKITFSSKEITADFDWTICNVE